MRLTNWKNQQLVRSVFELLSTSRQRNFHQNAVICHLLKYFSKVNPSLHGFQSNRSLGFQASQKSQAKMSYFVIGVSGVTCGGKTTLTKLLQRSFPWCRIIHQDSYFYDDDHSAHLRVPEVENHVNYEIMRSIDMPRMYKDIQSVLDGPGEFFDGRPGGVKVIGGNVVANSRPEDAPNFDTGLELLMTLGALDFDTSKYKDIPVLIIEGFIIFESQFIFEKCDVRYFVTLDKSECESRRSGRGYNPPDCPGYFEKIVWPEYIHHFERYVENRPGIKVFDGKVSIKDIWQDSVQIVTCRLAEKYFIS